MAQIDETKLPKKIKDKYSVASNAFKLDKIKNAEKDKYTGEPKDEINVIVGDDKQPDIFYPQVKLCRWTNETNFSVRLKDTEYEMAEVTTEGDKIKWAKGDIEIEFYDYEEGEGGYKMVWYLKKKPETNIVEFSLQTKGLDFFYQPELTQEEIDRGVFRPENVVDSYAIYHATKGGMNDAYGKDYKTGKFGHLYRIKLSDANGDWIWLKPNIDVANERYWVEIPQEFLDKAVYPIKSNDTFGDNTTGSSWAILADGFLDKCSIYGIYDAALPQNGTLDNINAYVKKETNNGQGILAVYQKDSVASQQHGLVRGSSAKSITSTTGQWISDTASSENLTSGQTYYIAVLGNGILMASDSDETRLAYDSGDQYCNYETYYASFSLENPWETASTQSGLSDYSIYATYTPSGEPPTGQFMSTNTKYW